MSETFAQSWSSVEELYKIEPKLKEIAEKAIAFKNKRSHTLRVNAYTDAKLESDELVGWGARDPRLRSSEAYDCFTDYILKELRLW